MAKTRFSTSELNIDWKERAEKFRKQRDQLLEAAKEASQFLKEMYGVEIKSLEEAIESCEEDQ